jgi:hypothetical protein
MYQQLWGYKVEEKLYLGVREQERLNTTAPDHDVRWPVQIIKGCVKRLQTCSYESAPHTNSDYVKRFVSFLYVSNRSQISVWYCVKSTQLDVSWMLVLTLQVSVLIGVWIIYVSLRWGDLRRCQDLLHTSCSTSDHEWVCEVFIERNIFFPPLKVGWV